MENPKMISERQAAALLGVHPSTLMRWRKDGIIPIKYEEKKYVRENSRIKYQEEEFLEWAKTFQI